MKLVIIKDKLKLVKKLWYIVWATLFVMVILKLTFNYWQPYVIPNEKLQIISDFIDDNAIIKTIIDKFFYSINLYFLILTGIRKWKFNKKYPIIVILLCAVLSALDDLTIYNSLFDSIISIFSLIVFTIIIDKTKWKSILLSFLLSNIFLFLSLWLENVSNVDIKPYIIKLLLNFDYYIMMILNYFIFNLFILRKE